MTGQSGGLISTERVWAGARTSATEGRIVWAPLWLERVLVWLGVLVGMAGPLGMIRAHDLRDWHQRQAVCPPHPSHGAGVWQDFWWQVHCVFALEAAPRFVFEPRVAGDRVYRWLERTWMLQQLPLAAGLWLWGGVGVVLWGITRIAR